VIVRGGEEGAAEEEEGWVPVARERRVRINRRGGWWLGGGTEGIEGEERTKKVKAKIWLLGKV